MAKQDLLNSEAREYADHRFREELETYEKTIGTADLYSFLKEMVTEYELEHADVICEAQGRTRSDQARYLGTIDYVASTLTDLAHDVEAFREAQDKKFVEKQEGIDKPKILAAFDVLAWRMRHLHDTMQEVNRKGLAMIGMTETFFKK